jgi:hypothetical protein
LKDILITLPSGTVISPSAADGLSACSEEQIGLQSLPPSLSFSLAPVSCLDSSKVGTAEVDTPLLTQPLQGNVYLAQQNANPFESLLALYLVVEGAGVRVKLAGEIHADVVTGQLSTTFTNLPQVSFTDVKLHFDGGSRASLANPSTCEEAKTTSLLTPYSGPPSSPSSSFQVSGCTAPQFAPSFTAGTASNQAGAYSSFSTTITRTDADQPLGGVAVKTPPGLLAILKHVEPCPEPQASQGTCGAGSLIGHTTAGAGPGSTPFYLPGSVYLTGPYKGAPYGLSIVVPAVAGPFNLGTEKVRARINVDPNTTQLTITTDPLPTILDGIPLQLKTINVTIDRPEFIFNPTNCSPNTISSTIASTSGAIATPSSRFQAAGCQSLPFHPTFTASSQAKTSRANGASLTVKVAYPGGTQANIHSVLVLLPKQLPARLSTIQHACPDKVFTENPAACDPKSLVGVATGRTPILTDPLIGPAYLVSHGGAAFPDIVMVLQSQGIRADLDGQVNISKAGITSTNLATVPDVPISSFQLNLPTGPHSALSATENLCTHPLTMPTTITAQNGTQIKQNTKINITKCPTTHTTTKNKKKKKQKK